jgi:serine/threonine-protein kinase
VISGGEAGPPADVYGLGVVLYELLAGRTPYAGEVIAVLRRHLDDTPDRPAGMPDRVWSVIESCLDKDPSRRPSAADLRTVLRDLARLTAAEPALPTPVWPVDEPEADVFPSRPPVPQPARRPRNRRRSWVWGRPGAIVALVAAALVLSGVGGYQAWRWQDASSARQAAGSAPARGVGGANVLQPVPGTSVTPSPPAGSGPAATVAPSGGRPGSGAGAGSGAAGVQVSAGPGGIAVSAKPGQAGGEVEFGPWRCGDELTWDVGHPVLAQPCQSLGGSIRVAGHIKATPGVQADVTMSVRDPETDDVVAGPYTCEGLMFTDFALEHVCGPVDLAAPHGGRYVVVEEWRYTGRSLLPGGTTQGKEFTW